jgi:hypothetical protein
MLQLRPSCECRDTLAQNLNGLSPRAARIAWASGLPGRDHRYTSAPQAPPKTPVLFGRWVEIPESPT